MIAVSGNLPPRRRGFGLIEMAVSAVLFAALAAITLQVVAWVALDRRAAARREGATRRVANVMERILARPWPAITTAGLAALAAPPAGADPAVDGTLRIEVLPAPPVAGRGQKRIVVAVEWPDRAKVAEAPVRLVAWTYEPGEARP